uniref:Uncharacterized protein n=1 Tax=Acrobeloides nanus TaxID=290746 RepID=A0A914E1F8_9BILA
MALAIDWRSWRTRFSIVVIFGTLFTLIALFTGGWGELKAEVDGQTIYTIHQGILTDRHEVSRFAFENWCVTAMFFSLFCEMAILIIVGLIYTESKVKINKRELVLTVLAGVATFLLLTVVIIYPAKANSIYKNYVIAGYGVTYGVSYSYGLAVVALILMLVSSIFGYLMMRE